MRCGYRRGRPRELWATGNLVRGLEAPVNSPLSSSRRSDCWPGSGPPRVNDVSGRPHPSCNHPCYVTATIARAGLRPARHHQQHHERGSEPSPRPRSAAQNFHAGQRPQDNRDCWQLTRAGQARPRPRHRAVVRPSYSALTRELRNSGIQTTARPANTNPTAPTFARRPSTASRACPCVSPDHRRDYRVLPGTAGRGQPPPGQPPAGPSTAMVTARSLTPRRSHRRRPPDELRRGIDEAARTMSEATGRRRLRGRDIPRASGVPSPCRLPARARAWPCPEPSRRWDRAAVRQGLLAEGVQGVPGQAPPSRPALHSRPGPGRGEVSRWHPGPRRPARGAGRGRQGPASPGGRGRRQRRRRAG